MRNLKPIIVLLVVTASLNAWGQREVPQNLPKFDSRKLHFGFQLGFSNNGFNVEQDLTKNDSLIRLEMGRQPGFIIHVISELHLGPYFGLRFTPGIAFASRTLNYTYMNANNNATSTVVRTIESTFVDVPLYLKYRSARVNNFAQYIFAGFNYSIDLASQQFVDNTIDEKGEFIVKLQRMNYMVEAGVGFDFFLEYFKFSPELRFSYGLNNIIVQDQTRFARPVNSLNSQIIALSFNFEG